MTVVGNHGPDTRSDLQVMITDGTGVEIESTVQSMYGLAIRDQVESCLARFGNPAVSVKVEDSGALPFVIEARMEAALCAHLGLPLPAIDPVACNPRKDRTRRTRLYVPGNSPKLFPNAALYKPDGIILDLEDSVPAQAKFEARALVRRALATIDFGSGERIVRINQNAMGLEDIEAIANSGVEALLIPKVESPATLTEISTLLEDLGSDAVLIPLLESALGVHRAYEIASATPRVAAISLGIEDYVADIKAERTEGQAETAWARGQVINAARAAGVQPLASVYPKFESEEDVYAYARSARAMGYEGVGCIHPRQIRPVHRAFAPTEDELAQARKIVDAYEAAAGAAVGVDGRMVDVPVYNRARDVLERGS